jgi:hypothetical protein
MVFLFVSLESGLLTESLAALRTNVRKYVIVRSLEKLERR